MADSVPEAVADAVAPVAEAAAEVVAPVVEAVTDAVAAASDIEPVVDVVIEAAEPVVEAVVEAAEPVVEAVAEAAAPVVEAVEEAAAPVIEAVVEAAEPVVEAVAEAAAPVVEAAVEAVEPAVEAIVEAAAPVIEAVIEAVEPAVEAIVEAVPNIEAPKAMAAPAKFDDLGKDAKDMLSKNFHFGVIKLAGSTKTSSGVEFTTEGTHNPETNKVSGSLETKFKSDAFDFTEKWTTDNEINAVLTSESKIAQGLKADLDLSFGLADGKKTGKLKLAYKQELFHATLDADMAGINGSAVVDAKGVLLGAKAQYDLTEKKLSSNALSLAYNGAGFTLHSGVLDMSKYFASIYHKVNSNLSAAATVSYAKGGNGLPSLAVGGKYAPDADSFYKFKIDNNLLIGCSYVTKLRDGVQLTLSSSINGKQLNGGGHQMGLHLDLSA